MEDKELNLDSKLLKSIAISTNRDVLVGLRLARIEGIYCSNTTELKENFNKYKKDLDIGIIVLVEDDFNAIEEEVVEIKLSRQLPLIVTIPDRNGLKDKDFIMRYIKESVGVKVD